MMVPVSGALLLMLITTAVGQENEVECLTQCGSDARILAVVRSVGDCCNTESGGAFNFPGAGAAVDCASCSDYMNIAGEIGFQFNPQQITINDPLEAECIVVTQAGLQNPRADILWLGPDGALSGSETNVPFTPVTRQGITQQEARLLLNFTSFGPTSVGEYSCLASITSDSFPGAETSVFRSVEIPSSVDLSTIPVPVYPTREEGSPVAGQPYFIDCVVNSPGLTNSDIDWVGPDKIMITATSGRVSIGDVFQDSNGRSVRRLTFDPLSSEDSGTYTCTSPGRAAVQTIVVDVPRPETNTSVVPPNPEENQPLQIDCSSAVPPTLDGEVTVTLLSPNGTVLAESQGENGAETLFMIPRASTSDSGMYTCRVVVRSPLLTSGGNPRPLEDTAIFLVRVTASPVNECVTGDDNCDVNAICQDIPEGFRCICREGFTGSGVLGDCDDIDECASGFLDTCSPDEICSNTVGSFLCLARPSVQPSPDTPSQPTPASPDTPSQPTPASPDTPSQPSPDTPGSQPSPGSPDTPSVEPSTAPTAVTPSEPTDEVSDPPLPVLPSNCHTHAELVESRCQCREGFMGDGNICCIANSVITLLRKQLEAGQADAAVPDREEDEEEDEESTTRSKKKRKGKRRGRRSRSRKSRKSCKTKKSKKSKKTKKTRSRCPEELDVPPVVTFDITATIPAECRPIVRELLGITV